MKHLIIRLTHCHVIQLRIDPKRLDSVLKSLEKAFTEKAAYMMRDEHGAAQVMIRGDQVVAWEVQDDKLQITTVDKLAR